MIFILLKFFISKSHNLKVKKKSVMKKQKKKKQNKKIIKGNKIYLSIYLYL